MLNALLSLPEAFSKLASVWFSFTGEGECCLGGLFCFSVSSWEGSFPYQSQILGVFAEHESVFELG